MTAAEWPRAEPGLERAYRRLLRAYPRSYRRRHGTEIVTTLLEMAEPGQRRPGMAEVRHLIASGIRQRFRLPAKRPLVWVAAVFALLIGGGLGAAAGSWTAERTFTGVPDVAAGLALHRLVSGGAEAPGAAAAELANSDSGSPWWGASAWYSNEVNGLHAWDVEAARERLIAHGWQVGPAVPVNGVSADTDGRIVDPRTDNDTFRAERDGLVIDVFGALAEPTGSIHTTIWQAGNASLLPLVAVGTLAGMAAGWMFTAAAAQRLRTGGPGRSRVATGLGVVTVAVLALPVVALYGNVVRAVEHLNDRAPVFTVHSALNVGPYWPWPPEWLNAGLAGAGLVFLAVLAVVVRGRRRVVAAGGPVGAGTGPVGSEASPATGDSRPATG